MEQIARESRIRIVGRREIIGEDARDPNDVREATQYLTEQRIINLKDYFKSKIVVNVFPKFEGAISKFWDVASDLPAVTLGSSTLTGAACTGYLLGLGFISGGVVGCGVGMSILMGGPILGAMSDKSGKKLTRQRQDFETALRKMDETISQFYPPLPKLKLASDQVA